MTDVPPGQPVDSSPLDPLPHREAAVRVGGFDLRRAFPFVHLFRGFRVAIHPSKMFLGVLAVLLIYTGGRMLDSVWSDKYLGVPQEVDLYQTSNWPAERLGMPMERGDVPFLRQGFHSLRDDMHRQSTDRFYALQRQAARDGDDADKVSLGQIKSHLIDRRDEQVSEINRAFNQQKDSDQAMAREKRDADIRTVYQTTAAEFEQVTAIEGVGLSILLIDYTGEQLHSIARGVLQLDFVGPQGVLSSFWNLVAVGPTWAITQHPLYFSIFFLYVMAVLAVIGGAITRIAAVHVARDERIRLREALAFSSGKFLSFMSAPLIPLIIVGVILAVLGVGSLVYNIPAIGPVLGGAMFFLALLAGFVAALILIGLAGGLPLQYPTIAVEGTDSFDAISRSFSYLYARPWMMAFYSLIALVYGVLTYLFIRLFIYLLLVVAFAGSNLLVIWNDAYANVSVLRAMWPGPESVFKLSYDIHFINLSTWQDLGAILIAFWVYLAVAFSGAYAISYFYSASTIIYLLLRQDVDATEMDEVYLEEQIDEFFEDDPASAPATSAKPDTDGVTVESARLDDPPPA